MSYEIQVRPNRRDLLTSEDAAASFQNMDVLVEPTWQKMFQTFFCISSIPGGQTCLRRFEEPSLRNSAHPPLGSDKYQ